VSQSHFPYQFRQASGGGNALGKLKFPIPDNHAIYLHDTSEPQLFSKESRALSSGCIRLADPKGLAAFLLADQPEWTADQIEASYDSTRNRNVDITPVPVHTVYWTAWVDFNGTVHFRDDVYQKDSPLLAALGPLHTGETQQFASR